MAFRWCSPPGTKGVGRKGWWRATVGQAKADAVAANMSRRGLPVGFDPEFVLALFQSLAREGWYIEEGRP